MLIPTLADVVEFLKERHEITAFVEIKRASLRRFGREQVVARVLDTLKPVRSRCVVISFDLPAVHMARQHGSVAIGWVLGEYDGHTRLKFEALKPEFLFCDHEKLPPGMDRLWLGPWRWAIYEVETLEVALSLAERGADFIETMAVAPMIQAFVIWLRAAQARDRMKHLLMSVVVGGGIHGVGVARGCSGRRAFRAAAGKTSLAAGTSSRSSKLIHGGLALSRERPVSPGAQKACANDAFFLRIAPELVQLKPSSCRVVSRDTPPSMATARGPVDLCIA